MLKKKWFRIVVIIFGAVTAIYLFRIQILRGFGNFLIVSDIHKKTEVIFVLSGSALDRGKVAAELFSKKYADRIICTGSNKDASLLALGIDMYESSVTRSAILHIISDSAMVDTLCRGTSTYEEREYILTYCLQQHIKSCMVVSSAFHTRRVSWLFKKKFRKNGIEVLIIPSINSKHYNAYEWWKSENGLIDLNNEYVKIVYYLMKYGF